MRCYSLVILVALLTTAIIQGQSSPTPLHDGQQVTLAGRLLMKPAGRLQFITVKTVTPHQPVFKGERGGKDVPGEVLNEIGLAGYSDYALLYAHRGQQVIVTGKMATDEATPYFWHGTRLQVTSIRLASGANLLQTNSPEPIAVDTGTYDAKAVLPANLAAPWIYTANGEPTPEGRFLSCSSNGGGDVVNCSCAKGFHPTAGQSVAAGSRQPAQLTLGGSMAQFGAGDDKHAIALTVSCSR